MENEYLKKFFRDIKKINKRLIHIKSGINFNNICLKEGLHPTFTNIKLSDPEAQLEPFSLQYKQRLIEH